MPVFVPGDRIAPAQDLQRTDGVQCGRPPRKAFPFPAQRAPQPMGQLFPLIIQQDAPVIHITHGVLKRTAAPGPLQQEARPIQPPGHGAAQPPGQLIQRGILLVLVGDGQLGRVGGGSRPQVGHKVGNGHVRLMAHGGDHGNTGGVDGAGHVLVVEGPQILHGAAAPAGND